MKPAELAVGQVTSKASTQRKRQKVTTVGEDRALTCEIETTFFLPLRKECSRPLAGTYVSRDSGHGGSMLALWGSLSAKLDIYTQYAGKGRQPLIA